MTFEPTGPIDSEVKRITAPSSPPAVVESEFLGELHFENEYPTQETVQKLYDQRIQSNEDGSVDLHFGPEAPEGQESNWIRTVPGKGWFTIFRLYGPLEGYMDKSWKPSDMEIV